MLLAHVPLEGAGLARRVGTARPCASCHVLDRSTLIAEPVIDFRREDGAVVSTKVPLLLLNTELTASSRAWGVGLPGAFTAAPAHLPN